MTHSLTHATTRLLYIDSNWLIWSSDFFHWIFLLHTIPLKYFFLLKITNMNLLLFPQESKLLNPSQEMWAPNILNALYSFHSVPCRHCEIHTICSLGMTLVEMTTYLILNIFIFFWNMKINGYPYIAASIPTITCQHKFCTIACVITNNYSTGAQINS